MLVSAVIRRLGRSKRFQICDLGTFSRRFTASSKWKAVTDTKPAISLARTRNVGIIAHIDAGKTTTTERMLYYSGHTKRIGNVDEGSTVTDFLPAERARGITIQSAAITFNWKPGAWLSESKNEEDYHINLIDTPGHADFTFEVLRSLRVLDGAVCILDGVAGVEAQTEKVWAQSLTYGIPTLFYVNKMDRTGAEFGEAVRQIASKLKVMPAVCQIPWYKDGKEHFQGVLDVVNLRGLKWEADGDGKDLQILTLQEVEAEDAKLAAETRRARMHLIEMLSEEDEVMVERFFEHEEDHLAVPAAEIWASLRRCLLAPKPRVSPVFAGSSFRNIGVQPVLDAITGLLPNPEETPDPPFTASGLAGGLRDFMSGKLSLTEPTSSKGGKNLARAKPLSVAKIEHLEACALAFKVVNDPKRGILVYVRIYSGSLNRNAVLFNTNLQTSERMPRLLRMYADDSVEEASLKAGEIGVIPGLKNARTGDTLITYTGINPKKGPPEPFNSLQLRPIIVPPPVFFAAVEPFSTAEQTAVDASLAALLREDPSLQVSSNEETGQQLLNGMGELHLEIAANRLIQDFKAKASIGKIEIAYRECPSGTSIAEDVVYERATAGAHAKAGCTATVSALSPEELQMGNIVDGNKIIINDGTMNDSENGNSELMKSLHNGALSALARGPTYGYPVWGAKVELTYDRTVHSYGTLTTPSAVGGAARNATRAAMEKSNQPILLEPVMRVIVNVTEDTLGSVKRDLEGSRYGVIESLDEDYARTGAESSSLSREDISPIDLRKVYAPPDPFEAPSIAIQSPTSLDNVPHTGNRARVIIARVPLKEMIGYMKHLRSLTAGRGSFVMEVDGFQRMSKQRENLVLKELRGDL